MGLSKLYVINRMGEAKILSEVPLGFPLRGVRMPEITDWGSNDKIFNSFKSPSKILGGSIDPLNPSLTLHASAYVCLQGEWVGQK